MPMIQYPFIDIAAQEKVREPYSRGEAVVVFSPDMADILWANGRGARLFGFRSVYDFLDHPPSAQDLLLRQLGAAARNLTQLGDTVRVTIRATSAFRRVAVTGTCAVIEIHGEPAVLFNAPVEPTAASQNDRARSMIEGLDGADTHLAVMDAEGTVVASSTSFEQLSLTPQTARMLVNMSGAEANGLVKRPVPTQKGYLPAALAKVSVDPALHLLFVVEAPAPGVDLPPVEAAVERSAEAPKSETPNDALVPSGFEEVVEAAARLEDIPELVEAAEVEPHPAAMQSPSDAMAGEPERTIFTNEPVEEQADAEHVHSLDDLHQSTLAPGEPEASSSAQFEFRPDTRATRFVWKIDADSRFCEISEEFAQTVGPHAADVKGMAFNEVAELFHLDPDGKITDLLRKRDTWSGKTIWWPVEGTALAVPIDLAALPTYTRTRAFDGFRGFGIIRATDAVEDPHAVGLSLGKTAKAENRSQETPEEGLEYASTGAAGDEGNASIRPEPLHEEATGAVEREIINEGSPSEADMDEAAEDGADQGMSMEGKPADQPPIAEEQPLEWPRGERPALRLVENGTAPSDKIIPLDQRRTRRESLSPVEQAAFREIARQLDSFIGRSEGDGIPGRPDSSIPFTNELEPETSAAQFSAPLEKKAELIRAELTDAPADQEESSAEGPAAADHDGSGQQSVDLTSENAVEEQTIPHADPEASDYETGIPLHRERSGLSGEILDQMPVALLVHLGDQLIHGNPEFLRLTGYESLEALAAVGGLDALLQRQDLEGKTDEAGGMVVVRADDQIVPVTARLQSVQFEQGTALMLALMPVADEREHQQESAPAQILPLVGPQLPEQNARLQVEVEELRAILETATDGVVVIDADGHIRSMNGAASALFNYNSEEACGKPFVMLFAHESQRAIVDYLGGLAGHGVASVLNDGREVIGREASGGFIPLFMTIGKLTSSNGYCAVIRDITNWKRTEEELRNAKRSAETANAHKSEFLAHVSHEIRTPLNAIIGFADLMSTERFGPIGHPRYIEYANDIVRSGRHVLDIVNDLLDISKIEAGEMELDFVAVDLNETISEAASLVQPQANGQRVIIRTALSQAVPPVVADARSVKQIVLNILSNAIRFTSPGGQIVVSTVYEANGSVVLRVRDTGIGMTRQELETAMKPFRQVAGSTRKRGDGTGLGLPLTKAMADANRASFSIQSAPREGTLVEIAFPSQRVLAN